MRKTINVPPPSDYVSFSPSELFRYFFQIGHWTEDSFSDEFQSFTRGKLVSTVTINKWKNRDVIPTRYSGAFFKFIENLAEPDMAAKWVAAFETVWARHTSGKSANKGQSETQTLSDMIAAQHQKWIHHLYTENREGDVFSPADIYVPLQLCGAGEHSSFSQEAEDVQDVEDLIEQFTDPKNPSRNIDWIFISGGPGSGKSMTALHMASLMCEAHIFPIYMRGSRLSNIEIDITAPDKLIEDIYAAQSFLKHFRASSFDKAVLILDGLDEINRGPHGTPEKLGRLISDLKIEQTACRAHNKNLTIIAFAREAHIEFAKSQMPTHPFQHLNLLSLDGRSRSDEAPAHIALGKDLREIWWEKYLAATHNVSDATLPDFLSSEYDEFSEFGSDPLLSYLICHTALSLPQIDAPESLPHERVNGLTYTANKNEIYQTIFNRLAQKIRPTLEPQKFHVVLQHIALAIWQSGNSRSVSIKSVFDGIKSPDTKAAFQTLSLSGGSTQTPPNLLITAFYYRLSQSETGADQSLIEFTHKSFSEYLTSTLIFDRFVQLILAAEQPQKFEAALKDWVDISRAGEHSPSLADFCQKEAAIRYETLSKLDWDLALKIIRNHIRGDLFSGQGVSVLEDMRRSHSLLFFIWSCLNLERQKRTDVHFSLPNTNGGFSVSDLKSIQCSNGLYFESGTLTEASLRETTFLSPALSALKLSSADMSQLSFSLGHIENIICDGTNFAMTFWSHVRLTTSKFTRSVFQQAIFHQWRVMDSHFTHCFFQGSRFQGATFSESQLTETYFSQCHFSDVEFHDSVFSNVVFDRCVFTQCSFAAQVKPNRDIGAAFRQCTFMDMEQVAESLPIENSKDGLPSTSENIDFQPNLEKLI